MNVGHWKVFALAEHFKKRFGSEIKTFLFASIFFCGFFRELRYEALKATERIILMEHGENFMCNYYVFTIFLSANVIKKRKFILIISNKEKHELIE